MIGGTKKMNLFQAVNDAMSIALTTDEKAGTELRIILYSYSCIFKKKF